MAEHETLTLALLAAHREVGTLPKLGRNEHGGFNYAPADLVVLEARKLLAAHGLIWVRTGARVKPPTLAPGSIGTKMAYVGDVEITGFIMHASERLPVCAEVPIVVQSSTPHDKSWASSVTFGTGYTLLGILNQDRANAEEISARKDAETPRVTPAKAVKLREMTERLAKHEIAEGRDVWARVCKHSGVTLDGDGYPPPTHLYATEGDAVFDLLSSLVASIPVPYLDLPGPRCSGRGKPLADSNIKNATELARLTRDKPGRVWMDVCAEAGIPLLDGKPHGASRLLTTDGERVRTILKERLADCQVDRQPGDDGDELPGMSGDAP